MDTISVITVTYNAAATLEKTISSVIEQTYPHIEHIIIDGKSTDNTVAIIKKYKDKLAYWITEKDNGVYDAMNKGIAVAKGDWLYFLGADDILFDKNVLKNLFTKTDLFTTDFVYGNCRLKSNNAVLGGSRTYYELISQNISHQAIFYKKNIFTQTFIYNLKYKILADYDLNLRVFKSLELKKKYIPIDVSLFNDKGGVSNVTIDSSFFADKLLYFIKVDKLSKTDPALQQYYFYHGIVLLLRDKKLKGLAYCVRAFTSGRRKFFYTLVFLKFILAWFGIGKKIKIV